MIAAPVPHSLSIGLGLLDQVRRHCVHAYPNEGCGILGGRILEDRKDVRRVSPAGNRRADRPKDRYLIDPEFHRKVDRDMRERGLQILGFFHSHPDVPATPSAEDFTYAWPGYSYLILSMMSGVIGEVRSWVRTSDADRFQEEAVLVRRRGAEARGPHE